MYNKTFLIGRLVRDPETRVTMSGISVSRFTIAVDRVRRKDQESITDFIRVVAWRRLAEICGEYLRKGKLVAVEGRLQIDTFERDGEKRESTEVVVDNVQMLDRRDDSNSMSSVQNASEQPQDIQQDPVPAESAN